MDCINETMLINSDITCETILPCVAELFVDERMGRCLVVNPLGPWWFIGEKLHADYVRLCDGKRTLVEIQNELSELGYGKLTDERMVAIAQSLQKAKIFDKTEKVSIEPASVVFFLLQPQSLIQLASIQQPCSLLRFQWMPADAVTKATKFLPIPAVRSVW